MPNEPLAKIVLHVHNGEAQASDVVSKGSLLADVLADVDPDFVLAWIVDELPKAWRAADVAPWECEVVSSEWVTDWDAETEDDVPLTAEHPFREEGDANADDK